MPTWNDVQQFVRMLALWVSGWLTTNGILPGGTPEELITGAVMGVGALVWWLVWNWTKKSEGNL